MNKLLHLASSSTDHAVSASTLRQRTSFSRNLTLPLLPLHSTQQILATSSAKASQTTSNKKSDCLFKCNSQTRTSILSSHRIFERKRNEICQVKLHHLTSIIFVHNYLDNYTINVSTRSSAGFHIRDGNECAASVSS